MNQIYSILLSLLILANFTATAQEPETVDNAPSNVTIIDEAPAGTVKMYHRTGNSLIVKNLKVVDVAQDGDMEVIYGDDGFVYLKDPVCYYTVGSYVKGTLQGNQITIPLGQKLHFYNDLNLITYCSELWFGDVKRTYYDSVLTSGSVARDTDTAEAIFEIDGDNIKLLDSNPDRVLAVFFDDTNRWAYFADYCSDNTPDYSPVKPATPQINSIEIDEVNWTAHMTCFVPLVDINGRPIASQKLYYRIFTDVERSIDQFIVFPEDYTGVDEGLTEIPYVFDNGLQITMGASKFELITPLAGVLNRVGIQSVYIDDNGAQLAPATSIEPGSAPNESDIFWYEIKPYEFTGVSAIQTNKRVAKVQYYNPSGMVSTVPLNGVNIAVTTYSDGSTSTTKVVR